MIPRESDFFLQFDESGTSIWTGVVEDRNDPAMMGRVRARIFGIHSMDRTEVPTEALPWATVILPTTMAALSGIGSSAPGIIEGTWVVGYFRDGASCQDPVILGAVLGNTPPNWGEISGQHPTADSLTGVNTVDDSPTSQSKIDVQTKALSEKTSSISSAVKDDVIGSLSGYSSIDDFPNFFEDREGFDEAIKEAGEAARKSYANRMSKEMSETFFIDMPPALIETSSGHDVEKTFTANLSKSIINYQKQKRAEEKEAE